MAIVIAYVKQHLYGVPSQRALRRKKLCERRNITPNFYHPNVRSTVNKILANDNRNEPAQLQQDRQKHCKIIARHESADFQNSSELIRCIISNV